MQTIGLLRLVRRQVVLKSNRIFIATMNDLSKLTRIQVLTICVFVIIKFNRPAVLRSETPDIIKTVFLSLPNFIEGFIGVLILTGLFLYINHKWIRKFSHLKVYILAMALAGVYVITQELRIHNLGGNNVYDPNDVLFSILGLALGGWVIYKIKPTITS